MASAADLLHLPPELLLEICDHLPPDAVLSLKLTHSIFNTLLPALSRLKGKRISKCARYAIERYCIPSDACRSRLRCILCKCTYPISSFNSSNSPACLPVSFLENSPKPEVVEIPHSFCALHVSRLARIVRTKSEERSGWISSIERMCMHGGCIQAWRNCECNCDSCGYKMVRTYTRYVNNSTQSIQFRFWRNTAEGESQDSHEKARGRLYVREVCMPSESHFSSESRDIIEWRMLRSTG